MTCTHALRVALLLLGCLCYFGYAQEWMEAEGVGKTPRDALQHALRAVVEQGVQSWVQARSLLINQQLREDIVHTVAQGYVKQYEVLEQRQEGEHWWVRIRASVQEVKAGITLRFSEAPALYRQAGEPRVLVLVEELVDGAPLRDRTPARTALIETLRREGIRVVELNASTPLPKLDNREALRALAKQAEADILLIGRAEATYFGAFAEGEVHSVRATIELHALWAEDGELIASRRTPPIAAAEFQKTHAESLALEKCARTCLEQEFLPLMAMAFIREIGEGRALRVRVKGDYSDLLAIREALQRYEHLVAIPRTEYHAQKGEGLLSVRIVGDLTGVGAHLSNQTMGNKRVRVVHQSPTGRELTVQMVP